MNKKAVILLMMMCIIAVLLVWNVSIYKGSEDESVPTPENQSQNVVEAETESETSDNIEAESSLEMITKAPYTMVGIVLEGEAASSLAAELESMGGGQQVIFGETYYDYNGAEYESESNSK